jgi:hypothetical protein
MVLSRFEVTTNRGRDTQRAKEVPGDTSASDTLCVLAVARKDRRPSRHGGKPVECLLTGTDGVEGKIAGRAGILVRLVLLYEYIRLPFAFCR